MASESGTGTRKEDANAANALWERKLSLLREVLALTQQGLLLVALDDLSPILERKNDLIQEIGRIDQDLAAREGTGSMPPVLEAEMARVVVAVLENERGLETRIADEQSRLRKELRDFDRQTRLKRYLERGGRTGAQVDLKK